MKIELWAVFFVLAVIGPGLLFLYYGLMTRRKRLVAIHTSSMVIIPFIIFMSFLAAGVYFYEYNDPNRISGAAKAFWDIVFLVVFLLVLVANTFMLQVGQILILRGKLSDVLLGIEHILINRRLQYTQDVNVYIVPGKMKIQVSTLDDVELVGIRIKTWDRDMKSLVHDDIMIMFKGIKCDRSYPSFALAGITIITVGTLALVGIFA